MSAIMKTSPRIKNRRRPGDPWISKNRVLNGGNGKAKRNCPIYRNPNFDTDETKLLIQLWGDPKTQRELITTHKKHVVIAQLSAKMEEYGYYRSPEEITTRIKNMKCFYNRLKKDMETTKNMDPSWRHYAEMDAIMTRPIFSVRPNEVPAPSLKYLLELEQEKRKERKRKAEEEGSTISDSDEDLADILAVPNSTTCIKTGDEGSNDTTVTRTSTDIELELDKSVANALENTTKRSRKLSNEENLQNKNGISEAEMAIKLEIESEQFQEYQSIDETESADKDSKDKNTEESIKTINITEDEELLVPKIEPIDVDEEFVNGEKTITQTNQISTNQSFAQLADILNQPPKAQNMPSAAMIKFSMPANSTSVTISTANSSTPTQSKISVVSPTILMSTQQISTKSTIATSSDQRQVRLPANLQALLAASGSRTTVTNGNGMKFLLVNTADQRGPPITTANLTSAIPLTGTNLPNLMTNQSNVKIIQNTTQLQQQPQVQQMSQPQLKKSQVQPQKSQLTHQQNLKPKEAVKVRQEYREQLKKRDLLGIKTALVKMLKVQEDANEIQNERLAIERERLQYERSIADRFLSILEQQQKAQQQIQQQLQQQQQLILQQQQPQHQHFQLQQRPTASSQIFTTNTGQATVTPNGQIMLPPKLLITTMVPNSAGQATSVSSSKVLATTSFANLTSTSNNDLQLVVPKEEPNN